MDQFASHAAGLESPATNAIAVTPSDSTDLGHVSRALYVGGDGNLAVNMQGGGSATFSNVVAGSVIAIRVSRVLSAGTTATDIVALY